MKIAIVGYGSMGKEIERAAKSSGIGISGIYDVDIPLSMCTDWEFDVAIDFTLPDTVLDNVRILAEKKKNIVIGTTGWGDKLAEVRQIVENSGIGAIYSSNFSIGLSMYSKILKLAAALANKVEGYDVFLHEMHHKRKKDSPSGTALTLSNILLEGLNSKNNIEINPVQGAIKPDSLHVSSTRGGEIVGTHTVYFDSLSDTIELVHRAKNRSGFASGAIDAAKWICDKKGLFTLENMLDDIWNILND